MPLEDDGSWEVPEVGARRPHQIRLTLQNRELPGKLLGPPRAIGDEECDPAASGSGDSGITPRHYACILLSQQADAAVGQPLHDRGTAVGRAIVNGHDLDNR